MEQRFLGEILQRRAGVPVERLEALCTRCSARRGSTSSTCW